MSYIRPLFLAGLAVLLLGPAARAQNDQQYAGKSTGSFLKAAVVRVTNNAARAEGYGYNSGFSMLGAWVDAGKQIGKETAKVVRILANGDAEIETNRLVNVVKVPSQSVVGRPVEAALGCDVGFDADDRLDAGGPALQVEGDGPVHDAVVGEPDRRHPELLRPGEHLGNAAGPVEHRVLRVGVQMHEAQPGLQSGKNYMGVTTRLAGF